jgi:hypothetical protein
LVREQLDAVKAPTACTRNCQIDFSLSRPSHFSIDGAGLLQSKCPIGYYLQLQGDLACHGQR